MPDSIPGESQVTDSVQNETSDAPVSEPEPAEVEVEAEPEPEPAPKRPTERQVPVSALIAERRRYQERLDRMQREFDSIKKSAQREEPETNDENEKHRRQWTKHLGVDKLSEQIEAMNQAIQEITGKMGTLDQVSQGSQLAVRQYVQSVENYANSQYDDSLPISKKQFEKLVAAEITPEIGDRLYSGDMSAIDEVVKIVKNEFRKSNPNAIRKANEVKKVTNLPKIPGKGGNPPQAREDAKPFTGLRDLHKDAWETFKSATDRRQE
jgi:hypothetical protein